MTLQQEQIIAIVNIAKKLSDDPAYLLADCTALAAACSNEPPEQLAERLKQSFATIRAAEPVTRPHMGTA